MNLNDVLGAAGKHRPRKRRGRGEGSGLGKTSGRGSKGAKARSGWKWRYGYEGGQMPIVRRVPKRGFNNFNFGTYYDVVNVGDLDKLFQDGDTVNLETLVQKGALKPRQGQLKLLGDGTLTRKLKVVVHTASGSARAKVEAAGGTLECLVPPRKIRKPAPRPGAKPAVAAPAGAPAEGEAPPAEKKKGKGGPEGEAAPRKEKKEKAPQASEGSAEKKKGDRKGEKKPGKAGEAKG